VSDSTAKTSVDVPVVIHACGFPAAKLGVSQCSVDTELFSPLPTSLESFHALLARQKGQRKGIGYLLDAWALARRLRVPWHRQALRVVPVDSWQQLLEEQNGQAGSARDVRVSGTSMASRLNVWRVG
jgi:hypothetical protein